MENPILSAISIYGVVVWVLAYPTSSDRKSQLIPYRQAGKK